MVLGRGGRGQGVRRRFVRVRGKGGDGGSPGERKTSEGEASLDGARARRQGPGRVAAAAVRPGERKGLRRRFAGLEERAAATLSREGEASGGC